MAGAVEYPDIRYVVYPVHLDGTLTGAKPRLRHDPGCSHFEWRDGTHLGTPVLATDEQMRILNACKSCIERRGESPRDARQSQSRGGNKHQAAQGAYVDAQVIAAIKAHHASGQFDWAKLLRLIDELNENYARGSTYAVHAVLRAILDHIPPVLGCTTFTAAANNYPWSRTDKAYMKRLLDFRLQADDALHRQISAQTDLLSLGDIPPRAWINRLLQECASPSGILKVARQDTAAAAGPRRWPQGNASRPNAMPGQASASLPTRGSVPQERAERIVIRLTRGGLKNNYVSLAKHLDFFPAAAIGASKVQDGEGALLTLHFAGLPETVETDIAGKHKFFRRRDPWRKFFAHHRLVEGDSVTIERLSPYKYRVAPLV